MKRLMMLLLVLALFVGVFGNVSAQYPMENHYLVYGLFDSYTFVGFTELVDQFTFTYADSFFLDKFANPVMKNGSEIYWPDVHQTWWIHDAQWPGARVTIDNQFGPQSWQVGDVRYLILPARKDQSGPPLYHNHYKVYEAFGPPVNMPVVLQDQFQSWTFMATNPRWFCNPTDKIVAGTVFPIIDDQVHLACYDLEPIVPFNRPGHTAYDQFGIWPLYVSDPCWLCLPTWKQDVVSTEKSTWGEVKALYHD